MSKREIAVPPAPVLRFVAPLAPVLGATPLPALALTPGVVTTLLPLAPVAGATPLPALPLTVTGGVPELFCGVTVVPPVPGP